jgi:hypothetical protein
MFYSLHLQSQYLPPSTNNLLCNVSTVGVAGSVVDPDPGFQVNPDPDMDPDPKIDQKSMTKN